MLRMGLKNNGSSSRFVGILLYQGPIFEELFGGQVFVKDTILNLLQMSFSLSRISQLFTTVWFVFCPVIKCDTRNSSFWVKS